MKTHICQQYLDALNQGHLENILSLFTPDAVVFSPLYGKRTAAEFYQTLLEDTSQSQTRLLNIFETSNNAAALHFHYKWTLATGKTVEFECVDVFETTPDHQRFKKLTIIYDSAPIRKHI